MSAAPLELAVPTTAPAAGVQVGTPAGSDAQAGQDFAALVAQALGLARPGTAPSPAAATTPAPSATPGDTDADEALTAPGTPGTAGAGTQDAATNDDLPPDAPVLLDQAARDAVVAALGLTPSTVPTPVSSPVSNPVSTPVTGPAATAAATPAGTATPATARLAVSAAPAATTTPVAATTTPVDTKAATKPDPKATPSTDQQAGPSTTAQNAAATTAAAATAPAATATTPDAATQPAGSTSPSTNSATVTTAAAALAAAVGAATGGAADGDGPQDGQERKDSTDTANATVGATGTTAPADATPAPATTPAGDTVQVVASGPVVVTPAVQATPGRTHGAHQVVSQVIPEITRLVSDGEGVHRVTLQLNPRALGDVRVVLTMRQGDVHVRLVAGDDARVALAQSSSELTRALDQLGLKDHRISLSPLADPASTTWSSGSDQTNDPRQHGQHPGGLDADLQDQKNAQHLWMGDDSTATDGMTPSTSAGRTSRSVTVPTFGATPAGALDVRM